MENRTPKPLSNITSTNTEVGDMQLKIIQVAGGDRHFADTLRGMIWQEYCEAGQPFGPSEEAMFLWMEHQLQLEGRDW